MNQPVWQVAIISLALSGCMPHAESQVAVPTAVAANQIATQPIKPAVARPKDKSDEFFADKHIVRIKIELSDEQAQKLREDARRYVPAKLIENDDKAYADVAIKLKGAAGSFQDFDARPAFTVNFDKFRKGQKFHDLAKLHLNNSVQDESYLCELLCSDISRAVGLPTPRVTHARVWLGERDLGLYVVKEGFDKGFLKRNFAEASGNLYEGPFVADIDTQLERDAGEGPPDGSDLKSLVEACQQEDAETRWRQIDERLNVDSFITFMAIELMTCHWDGYTLNRNNYRIYFEPPSGKAMFMLHGMDQMFQDPGFDTFPFPEPLVARAVLSNPVWRAELRARVAKFLPHVEPAKLHAKIDEVTKRLAPALATLGEEAVNNHADRVRELKERITARYDVIKEHLIRPDDAPRNEPPADDAPLNFEEGPVQLTDFHEAQDSEDPQFEVEEVDDKTIYSVAVGPSGQCVASWRKEVVLPTGKYRFSARMKAENIVALESEQNIGAGLRISGGTRDNAMRGNEDWQLVAYEFDVGEPSSRVVLVAELRATAGRVWIEAPLMLEKLE